jgi:hypothetical protein
LLKVFNFRIPDRDVPRRKGDILTDTTGLCNYMAFELAELAAENLFQVSSLGEEASYPVSRPGEGSP